MKPNPHCCRLLSLRRLAKLAWFIFLFAALAGWTGTARLHAQAKPNAALPPDLELVPPDAVGFIHIRAAELWKSDALADLRRLITQAGTKALQAVDARFVPAPSTIERITVILPATKTIAEPFPPLDPEAMSALLVVTTSKPFDRTQFLKGLAPESRPKKYLTRTYQFLEKTWHGLYLVDDRTLVYGSEDALVYLFDHLDRKRAAGPLDIGLHLAGQRHHAVVALNARQLAQGPVAQATPPKLQPILHTQTVTAVVDLDQPIFLDVRFHFAKDEQAREGEEAVRASLDLIRETLTMPIQQVEQQLFKDSKDTPTGLQALPEALGSLFALGMFRQVEAELTKIAVKRQGRIVSVPVTAPAALGGNRSVVPAMAMVAISSMGQNAHGTFSFVASKVASGGNGVNPLEKQLEDNLSRLGAAFDKHHADHGHFPAAAITDKNGQPLLSWRVALLPYLGQDALYRQFKLDEPWDSLHNKRLLKKIPQVFQDPVNRRYNQPWWTRDLVFTGPGTVFEGSKGLRKSDIPDGLDKTLLLVHVPEEQAIYWTKPADVVYAADKPLPTFTAPFESRFRVVLANGGVRVLNKTIPERTLRALITRNGGEQVDVPE